MLVFEGKTVCGGVAAGKIHIYFRPKDLVQKRTIEDPEYEIKRFHEALCISSEELKTLYKEILSKTNGKDADIIEAQRLMSEDGYYSDMVEDRIRTSKVNAEYAVSAILKDFEDKFSGEDEFHKNRFSDIKDFSERIIRILSDKKEEPAVVFKDMTAVFEDPAPSDIIKIDSALVKAVIIKTGSLYSHVAILIKAKNIPAVICPDFPVEDLEGKEAVVDGDSGRIFLEADDELQNGIFNSPGTNINVIKNRNPREVLNEIENKIINEKVNGISQETVQAVPKENGRKISNENEQKVSVENTQYVSNDISKKATDSMKTDKSFSVCANISDISELDSVIENNADGIGLFRTEFIFIRSKTLPTEDEQFLIYSETAKRMAGKKVIIRTMDIGSDKKCDCIKIPEEENPSMGLRGIRLCLKYREIFKTQLRAILRASTYGKISIMLPMITDVSEVEETKKILDETRAELDSKNIDYDKNIELGIMVETPAAVMCADELAQNADFFSVGTNDLTQYTLAIDRNSAIADVYYDPHHPAIMKMLKATVDAAHKNGIKATVCGELGADVNALCELINMGYDGVSVTSGMIGPIRQIVER